MSANANDPGSQPATDPLSKIRAGATVLHKPSGETWVVYIMRGNTVIAADYPQRVASVEDCELIQGVSDEDHIAFLYEITKNWEGGSLHDWSIGNLILAAKDTGDPVMACYVQSYLDALRYEEKANEVTELAQRSQRMAIFLIRAKFAPPDDIAELFQKWEDFR